MALAHGTSRLSCGPISDHTRTTMAVCAQLVHAQFTVITPKGVRISVPELMDRPYTGPAALIECIGAGFVGPLGRAPAAAYEQQQQDMLVLQHQRAMGLAPGGGAPVHPADIAAATVAAAAAAAGFSDAGDGRGLSLPATHGLQRDGAGPGATSSYV